MKNFNLNGKNKYYSLYGHIRGEILSGKIKKGEKLPSKRALASELGVSVITVQLAYEQLLAEGYIVSRERSGYFAEEVEAQYAYNKKNSYKAEDPRQKKYRADLVNGKTPSALFPFWVWAKLMRNVLSDCGEHLLERVPGEGDWELRRAISDYLYRSRGIDADPRRIIVGAGAEHLYGVIVQLLGRDKIFAVENPGYSRISMTYELNGAKFVPVNVGSRGIDMEMLENSRASVAHISPSHQFPTGAVTPVSSRIKIINWAKKTDGYIIEDDYDSEFRLSGKPLQSMLSLNPDRVIYVNTFSKSLAPSMRMGYMILPPALFERFEVFFSRAANTVPLFEQKTLAAMLDGGYFERHISRLKKYYKDIRKLLIAAISSSEEKCEITDTGSGLHMVVRFPAARSDDEIKRAAEKTGVNIKCLSDYLIAPYENVDKCAVINYSGLTREIFE